MLGLGEYVLNKVYETTDEGTMYIVEHRLRCHGLWFGFTSNGVSHCYYYLHRGEHNKHGARYHDGDFFLKRGTFPRLYSETINGSRCGFTSVKMTALRVLTQGGWNGLSSVNNDVFHFYMKKLVKHDLFKLLNPEHQMILARHYFM